MHRFEEDPVVPALGAPPGAAGPEDLQHRRPILLFHPRQHGRLLPNRPAKCHRSTNVGIHSLHTQPNPSTRPRVEPGVTLVKSSLPWPRPAKPWLRDGPVKLVKSRTRPASTLQARRSTFMGEDLCELRRRGPDKTDCRWDRGG